MYGRVTDEDLRPVSALMQPGWILLPPRSCRTRTRSPQKQRPTWRLKRAYADRQEARAAAEESNSSAYLCRNCDFWHTGMLRGPRPE